VSARAAIVSGAIAGLAAGLTFAAAHAMIITPIWNRMIGGLVFGVLAGAAAGWAFGEMWRDERTTVRSGLLFGFMLWLAVVPVTLTNAALRSTGFAYEHRDVTDAIAIVLAVAGGLALGWLRAHRLRATIACAAAALVVTMAMGGPVPVGRSVRAVEILFAVLAACLLGGAVVGLLTPSVEARLRR